MKPILYRFSINGHIVNPEYKDNLSIDYSMENNQQFFRKRLSGKIAFIREDYDWLDAQDFETEFILKLEQSLDNGKSWSELLQNKFMKTDCTWDIDNKKIEVQPDTYDDYNSVLDGLDKEYNLIKLCPEMERIHLDRRPLIQLYIPGQSVVSCFVGGTYWEQDVTEEVDDTDSLANTYHFARASVLREVVVTANNASIPGVAGVYAGESNQWTKNDGLYYIRFESAGSSFGIEVNQYRIYRTLDGEALYYALQITSETAIDGDLIFLPISDSGATGNPTATVHKYDVWTRLLTDRDSINSQATMDIPATDIVADNRNYRKCKPYTKDVAVITHRRSTEPTEYGLTDDGDYYTTPLGTAKYYPIGRSAWQEASIWFDYSTYDYMDELSARQDWVLKDAYELSSVISVLLAQFSDITHEATTEYSQFLYSRSQPIGDDNFRLFLTQKSNLMHGNYDQPAQKAEITLGTILNALRDIFKCYWYIEDGKLKIEHILWFKNGGAYTNNSVIGVDLTQIENATNRKKWGYLTSNYEYDKVDMSEQYQFAWMDDVTETFEGYPIIIRSKYVTSGKIEDINISSITTDVDYIMLNPSAISEDGFVLMAAQTTGSYYYLPYRTFEIDGASLQAQNGFLTWIYLHENFWRYDLPAKKVTINNKDITLTNVSRKKKQKVKFPTLEELDTTKLIKTYLGNGQIEKITVNLSSRMNEVTLKYDTEQ